MIQAWVDCETTGIDPIDSAAFEIAFLIYEDVHFIEEKVFHLNPLIETIVFSEEAYRINGVSEETIRSYPPAETVMKEMSDWLWLAQQGSKEKNQRFVFAGYCADFDYGHVKALFDRYGIPMDIHFDGRIIDVYKLVKQAHEKRIIGYTPNKKLGTMTKALGIPHDSAHTALSDIWATRKLYETIYAMERRMK